MSLTVLFVALLCQTALSSLKRTKDARLYIMQHGSFNYNVSGAVQDKAGRSFHTRDGWLEFCNLLKAEGEVTILPYVPNCLLLALICKYTCRRLIDLSLSLCVIAM